MKAWSIWIIRDEDECLMARLTVRQYRRRKSTMKKSSISMLLKLSSCSIAVLLSSSAMAADKLTVVGWGGAVQEAIEQTYLRPFEEKSGISISTDSWNGEIAKVQAMAETGNVTWDLVSADYAHAIAGCDLGFLERIDYSKLGNPQDFAAGANHPCGVSDYGFSFLFAYDGDRVAGSPQSLADIFDLEKWPGRRGFWKSPKLVLEQALIADGVPAAEVYDVLGTPEGLDRAFAKLDTIRDNIVWWEGNAQAVQLIADGEVTFGQVYSGHIYRANQDNKKNFKMIWDGQVLQWNIWVIPKGAHKAEAEALLGYMLEPERMAALSNKIAYGPSRASAIQYADKSLADYLPTSPEHLTTAVSTNEEWWADHYEDVNDRFQQWLSR